MPTSNFNGADLFNYRVTDGKTNSSIATATILVSPGNDAPVAVDDRYTILENSNLVVTAAGVLANDADIDGDVLRAVLVAGPAHGTVTLSARNVTLVSGAQFQHVGDFTQTVNGKRAELDLGKSLFVTVGVNWSF